MKQTIIDIYTSCPKCGKQDEAGVHHIDQDGKPATFKKSGRHYCGHCECEYDFKIKVVTTVTIETEDDI